MHSISILIPTLKKGGAEKQAALLAKVIHDSGHSVVLIVVNGAAGFEPELVALCGLPDSDIVCLPARGKKRALRRVLRERKVDTMFCYLTWPDFWGPIVGRMAGVKRIYQGLRNASLPAYKMLLEAAGNVLSTGAIVNNHAGVPVFRRRGIRRMTVIPNCYPSPRPAREAHEDAGEVRIITVGRFVEQKDYPTAIAAVANAMAANSDLRFTIIGHGELETIVRSLVQQHGIADRTEILINPPGIVDRVAQADIYLSTSLFEGTSNSIMEALDVSLPVVATRVGDNDRLIDDGVSGFLTRCGDTEAIATALLRLAGNPALRLEMGAAGHRLLIDRYGMEAFSRSYLNIIEQ